MKTNIFTNMLKLSGGTTITQIMGILVLPILSRVYSPEYFGVYALFFSISNILLVVAIWQYNVAIVIPKNYEDSINLFFLSILILSFMSLIFFGILIFLNDFIFKLFNLNDLSNLLFLIPVHIFISGVYQSLRYLNSRNNAFGNSAKSAVVNSGITYLSQILLGVFFANGSGLIYGSIFGLLVGTIYLLTVSIKFISFKSINLLGIKKVMYEYKKFPIFTTPGTLLAGIGSQLPVIMLSSLFGIIYSGFYSIADKAINIPAKIITSSISEVSYKHISDIVNDNKLLSNYIEKSMAGVLQISIIPFFIILIFGRILTTIFLGEQWASTGLYVQILLPLVFLQLLCAPIGIFFQKNRNDIAFLLQIIYLMFSILGLSIGYIMGSSTISIILFSLLVSIHSIFTIYLNFRLANASFKNMFYHFRTTFYLKKYIKQIYKK